MECPYCGSSRITVSAGEYVCAECGSVIGPVLYAPLQKIRLDDRIKKASLKILLYKLNNETINNVKVKINLKEKIRGYIEELHRDLEAPSYVLAEAVMVLDLINKRRIQGKNPRVLAATIFYLVANKHGLSYDKDLIAKRLGVSKLSIRDTATYLRKLCKELR